MKVSRPLNITYVTKIKTTSIPEKILMALSLLTIVLAAMVVY